MNFSNLKDLRKNLNSGACDLGIDSEFLKHPAYESVISEINSLISQMNISVDSENIVVGEENGTFSFRWVSSVGDDYHMVISSSGPNSLRAIRTTSKTPFIGTNGQMIHSKDIIEVVADYDEGNKLVTITMNGSMLDDARCKTGVSNNTTWSKRRIYNDKGVMTESEYKGFPTGDLLESVDSAKTASALCIPRNAFNFGMWHNLYISRELLRREYLDTARILVENKVDNFRYFASTQLNAEHGVRDMRLVGGYDPYPAEVTIPQLSTNQISYLIGLEDNPVVQEGLREYAQGRENYFYDSSMDSNFERSGGKKASSLSETGRRV